jgi:GGDEF domain-containing protein
MKNIKVPLLHLLLFFFLVFNLEKLPFGSNNSLNFHWYLVLLLVTMPVVALLVPAFQKLSTYVHLVFWLFVYFGVWFLLRSGETPPVSFPIILIEVALVGLGAVLVRELTHNLVEVEHTLDQLVFANFTGRALSLTEAADEIQTELQRSRRYQRALTVLVVEPDAKTLNSRLMPTIDEIQHNLAKRYALGKVSEALSENARRPDLIIRDEQGERFFIICPETTRDSSETLIQRMRAAIRTDLGISLAVGVASFPEDALTIEDLLNQASLRLSSAGETSLTRSSEEKLNLEK